MYASLQKLAALPGDTRVYCAHEYTLDNIRFALAVEPDNAALAAREVRERGRRDAGLPTLPSTLASELATNPFLRCTQPAIVESASRHSGTGLSDPIGVFAAIRGWKNHF
jgi:hydroxyacylglutathione hydrolase